MIIVLILNLNIVLCIFIQFVLLFFILQFYYDAIKTYLRIQDQTPTLIKNIIATLEDKPLIAHSRGNSLQSQISGPAIVALGHDHPEGVGIGPDLPGCLGWCCWCVCLRRRSP